MKQTVKLVNQYVVLLFSELSFGRTCCFSLLCAFPPIQVVALQKKQQALFEENQKQAEELVVWRSASKPAPAFDQIHPYTGNQCEMQNQIASQQDINIMIPMPLTQSQDPTVTGQTHIQVTSLLDGSQNPGHVTVMREDELFLSCSSNRLQGRMLSTR